MLQTAIIVGNAFSAEFHVPGFVRIDEMRQIEEFGVAEFYCVYDDQDLHTVYRVGIGSRSDGPPQQLQEPLFSLGKARLYGGAWGYSFYYVHPAPRDNIEKTMMFSGRAHSMTMYVPGFVAIEKVRQIGEFDQVEVYVRYNTTNVTEIHKLQMGTTGPDRRLPAGATDLGLIHPVGSWAYVHYTDEILPAAN